MTEKTHMPLARPVAWIRRKWYAVPPQYPQKMLD